jgi:hypothetical protein
MEHTGAFTSPEPWFNRSLSDKNNHAAVAALSFLPNGLYLSVKLRRTVKSCRLKRSHWKK